MTDQFKITELGFYRTRDGGKVEVVEIDPNKTVYPVTAQAVDPDDDGFIDSWNYALEGYWYDEDIPSPGDIVSKWEQPNDTV